VNNGNLVEVRDLKTWFPVRKGVFQRIRSWVRAVDGVSFSIPKGKTLALVGESGCGKTTVGKTLLRLVDPQSGSIRFDGVELGSLNRAQLRPMRKRMQIVFQDPANSLDPRMLVRDVVAEGIRGFGLSRSGVSVEEQVIRVLERVELDRDVLLRYPHEFSGGQRQRICIARALAVEPDFIVCDEATSALDVSVQASILNLLKSLQNDMGLTYLFITHDLSVVEYLSDRVAVMYLGQIVEENDTETLFNRPNHPYTEALLRSAPSLDPDNRDLVSLDGDVPSPMNPPAGCRFHPRCPRRFDRCDREEVPTYTLPTGTTRCFLHDPKKVHGNPPHERLPEEGEKGSES
jgi:peptide/nickel transport system ATP-binding protein